MNVSSINMFAVLLPSAWVMLYINGILWCQKKRINLSKIEILLISTLTWSVVLLLGTETLSLFHFFTFEAVRMSWMLICIFLCFTVFALARKKDWSLLKFRNVYSIWKQYTRFQQLIWMCVGTIFLITAILGLLVPPNDADALSYHMPRVMHWKQQQSVDFYPSHITRQINLAPFAEYVALHVIVLGADDVFVNAVQWFSCVGTMLCVWALTKCLGGNKAQCLYAVMFALTIPIGVLEMNSGQNDYVVTFFLITCIYFFLKGIRAKKQSYFYVGAVSFGLALLTKGTTYFFGTPFLLWFGYEIYTQYKLRAFKILVFCGLIIVIINSSFYLRNIQIFHTPVKDFPHTIISNGRFSVTGTVSNLIKNVGMHLFTPFQTFNVIPYTAIEFVHMLSFESIDDVDLNSFVRFQAFLPNINEDVTVNTVHLLCIVILFMACSSAIKEKYLLSGVILSIFFGLVFFSFFVRWTPWNSRYHLTLFVVTAPWIGLCVTKCSVLFQRSLLIFIYVVSLVYICMNQGKPVFPVRYANWPMTVLHTTKSELYFASYRQLQLMQSYRSLVNYIVDHDYHNIGLIFEEVNLEYPLWIYLSEKKYPFLIEHIDVKNGTEHAQKTDFVPDVIIYCSDCNIYQETFSKYKNWPSQQYIRPFYLFGK